MKLKICDESDFYFHSYFHESAEEWLNKSTTPKIAVDRWFAAATFYDDYDESDGEDEEPLEEDEEQNGSIDTSLASERRELSLTLSNPSLTIQGFCPSLERAQMWYPLLRDSASRKFKVQVLHKLPRNEDPEDASDEEDYIWRDMRRDVPKVLSRISFVWTELTLQVVLFDLDSRKILYYHW